MNTEFTFKLNPDRQLSPILMDNHKPFNIFIESLEPHKLYNDLKILTNRLQDFLIFRNFLVDLGEAEHSSDWDLYLIITLRDGTKIQTDSGYDYFEIQDDKILVEDYEDNGEFKNENDSYHLIPINQISSISLGS
jgi:hypothetical protein